MSAMSLSSRFPSAATPSTFGIIALAVHVLSLYIFVYVSLADGITVPAAWTFPTALVLWIRNFHMLSSKHLIPLVIIVGVGLLSIFLRNDISAFLFPRLLSLGLLIFSLFLVLPMYLEICRYNSRGMLRFVDVLLIIFLIGILLEHATPLRDLSDAFRDIAFEEWRRYQADVRDLEVAGFVRPKLFGSEPSYLGLFLVMLLSARIALDSSSGSWIKTTGIFLMLAISVGSPTLMAWPIVAVALLLVQFSTRWSRGAASLNDLIAIVSGLMLAIFIVGSLYFLLQSRLSGIITGNDVSMNVRLLVPFQTATYVLQENPWFGIGVGGDDALEDIIVRLNYGAGMIRLIEENASAFVGAVGISILTFHGLLGAPLIVFGLWRLCGACGSGYGAYGMSFALVTSMFLGGYTSARWWFYVFFVLGVCNVAARKESRGGAKYGYAARAAVASSKFDAAAETRMEHGPRNTSEVSTWGLSSR